MSNYVIMQLERISDVDSVWKVHSITTKLQSNDRSSHQISQIIYRENVWLIITVYELTNTNNSAIKTVYSDLNYSKTNDQIFPEREYLNQNG